jgi:hypothetical protein
MKKKMIVVFIVAAILSLGCDDTETLEQPSVEDTSNNFNNSLNIPPWSSDDQDTGVMVPPVSIDDTNDLNNTDTGNEDTYPDTDSNTDIETDLEPIDPCSGVTCSFHGLCEVRRDVARCNCDSGYQETADLLCIEIQIDDTDTQNTDPPDPCQGVNCSFNGECVVENGQPACNCDLGYEPAGNLQCVQIDNNTDDVICHEWVIDWLDDWASFEQEVLVLVNQERARGANCGGQGTYPSAGPLTMEPHLRCAARVHSMDMGVRNFFDHDSPDGPLGDTPWERMDNSGYPNRAAGENIAAGQRTPADVVQGWMDSDGHCVNIMNDRSTEIGIGYAHVPGSRYTMYWTQNFGRN